MASQSENPVSVELGELLELLNALEAQDSRPKENFATLERMLAAGKTAPAESFSDDRYVEAHGLEEHYPEQHDPEASYSEEPYSEELYSEDRQSAVVGEVDSGIADAEEPTSIDELIAQRPDWHEQATPEADIENRLAVHIIQGLRKSIKDRTS